MSIAGVGGVIDVSMMINHSPFTLRKPPPSVVPSVALPHAFVTQLAPGVVRREQSLAVYKISALANPLIPTKPGDLKRVGGCLL